MEGEGEGGEGGEGGLKGMSVIVGLFKEQQGRCGRGCL